MHSDTEKYTWLSLMPLSCASALLLAVPWLVPHCGLLALVGFIPLLCAERIAFDRQVRHFWACHYSAFVLWNALTCFWVCNATVGGGLFTIFANAFLMSFVFGLFRFVRGRLGGCLPYLFLAAAWIGWERFTFDAEISWPWLTLGNAFAESTSLVQWYEYTGSLGGSLWVWTANLAVFGLMGAVAEGRWEALGRKARAVAACGVLLALAGPALLSLAVRPAPQGEAFEAAIIQPDFDPYEKFGSLSQQQQNEIAASMIDKAMAADSSTQLVLLPETFTGDITVNDLSKSPTWSFFSRQMGRYPSAELIMGASTYELLYQAARPSWTARKLSQGVWYESHNSALNVNASRDSRAYHKSKLVSGVEWMPYPRIFSRIDDALGGVMGRCIGQKEVSLLDAAGVPVGCAVCYESAFGEYCTGYVRKGARLMTVITNDAWWGDTPGYKQHLSFSRLRAIELRRDIVRCANTGISALIDSRGDIIRRSEWCRREVLAGTVHLNDTVTAFVRYGDVVGRICTVLSALLLLAAAAKWAVGKLK